jgi:uncharacterized protein (TIGR03437 family)
MKQTKGYLKPAKLLVAAVAVPILVWAYAGGPDPRHTGAPGDQTCAQAGCHIGTAVNGGPGSVAIEFPSGLTYTPGTRQRWTIRVTDAQQRTFGFQATARLESNLSGGQAGAFQNTGTATAVLCDDGSVRPAAGCRDNFKVEFIQHSNSLASGTWTVEWDPPATNVGPVRVYIAGNAANGNNTNSGDRIYTANYTLTPATGGGGGGGENRPSITENGVASGFSFAAGIAPNSWTAIVGTNLAAAPKDWTGAIQEGKLPTTLEGVSVTINEKPATVFFVSPAQLNVLVPNDIGVGDVPVVVTNANGASTPFTVRAAEFLPAFYSPFAQEGRLFVTAVALDGTFVGKQGVDPRVTRGAKPGEILQFFGTGFGPTNPVVPTDQIVNGAPAVTTPVRIRFGETVANVLGGGNLVAAGLYQFNVTVPATLEDGDVQLIAEVGGVASSSSVYITIQR